jgi:hypothetical protein
MRVCGGKPSIAVKAGKKKFCDEEHSKAVIVAHRMKKNGYVSADHLKGSAPAEYLFAEQVSAGFRAAAGLPTQRENAS